MRRKSLLIAGSLACILLSGCGLESESKEKTQIIEQVIEESQDGNQPAAELAGQEADCHTADTPPGELDFYGAVLEEYRDMVQHDFYTDLRDTDSYESSFGKDIGFEIRTHVQDIYYAFYDINKDGIMELVIAGGENAAADSDFSPWLYDLYGCDGAKVVHIFPDMDFGYRTNFSLYGDGTIEVFYSSSAAESGIDFYALSRDGFTPVCIDSFAVTGHLEDDEAVFEYSRNGEAITEEEYNTWIQSYEIPLTEKLDWVQIR